MLILIFSFQIFKVFFVAFSLLYQVLPTLGAAANVVCEEYSLVNRLHNVFMKMQKGFCVGWVRLGVRISNNHYLGVKTMQSLYQDTLFFAHCLTGIPQIC